MLCIPLYAAGSLNPQSYELSKLNLDTLDILEADSFWCMSLMLDKIQVCRYIYVHVNIIGISLSISNTCTLQSRHLDSLTLSGSPLGYLG